MKRFLILLFLVIAIITVSACTAEENVNVLKVSRSSDQLVKENYQTVISEFETIGFTAIKTAILDDLVTGWLTKDGSVEKVEINGKTEFSANTSFPKDAQIVITYHTFPEKEKSVADPTGKVSSEPVVQSTEEPSKVSNQEILTVENNKELAALLTTNAEFDPIYIEFAKKYAGRTIEFDGNIANMALHGDYKTRYDFLIYAGDYSETTCIGPAFKFKDVNMFDFHLTGSKTSVSMGQNLHITAKVVEYIELSELFFLEPISNEIR